MRALLRKLAWAVGRRLSPGIENDVRLGRYARECVLPRASGVQELYVPTHFLGHAGFDLNVAGQLKRIQAWRDERYQRLFHQMRANTTINTGLNGQTYGTAALHNGFYPTPDAESYAAMILEHQPDQIVEVGSGFSTLVARQAIAYSGGNTKLTAIDPQPRTDVSAAADKVITKPVEDAELDVENWTPKSILFIDSSHVCRSRGDLPRLFCQVLPNLPPGVIVHVHDIFTPYDYPTNYDSYCYTEQYLLQCLLSGSERYRTILTTHYLSRNHAKEMQATFGGKVGEDPLFFGGSYWFEVRS